MRARTRRCISRCAITQPSVDIAIMGQTSGVNMLAAENQVAYVQQQRVGAGYFRVLGIAALMGREFTREEDEPGGPSAAILSHHLWARTFNSDPNIVGQTDSVARNLLHSRRRDAGVFRGDAKLQL